MRGWQRAGALAQLFRRPVDHRRPGILPVPVAIFATRVEAGERSRRPLATVEPLAKLLGLAVDRDFDLRSEGELARRAALAGGPSLVCWHHEALPALAKAIAPDAVVPADWPDDRFDLVWLLEQAEKDAPWTLEQVPQLLLTGDRVDPIGP